MFTLTKYVSQKDVLYGYDITADFKQWNLEFNKPVKARLKCGEGEVMTMDEVYQLCNTLDPLQIPRCGLPVTFKCGSDIVTSIIDLSSMGSDIGQLDLAIAPPVAMPFVRVVIDLPGVPTYNLIKNMDVQNNTLALIAMTSIKYSFNGVSYPMDFSAGIDFQACAGGSFTIGGDCDSCDYEIIDGETLLPVSAVASNPHSLPCELSSVQELRDYLNTTIYKLKNANSEAEFSKGINTLNLVTNMDAVVGCKASIKSLITKANAASLGAVPINMVIAVGAP